MWSSPACIIQHEYHVMLGGESFWEGSTFFILHENRFKNGIWRLKGLIRAWRERSWIVIGFFGRKRYFLNFMLKLLLQNSYGNVYALRMFQFLKIVYLTLDKWFLLIKVKKCLRVDFLESPYADAYKLRTFYNAWTFLLRINNIKVSTLRWP